MESGVVMVNNGQNVSMQDDKNCRISTTFLYVSDLDDDLKLLEEIVVKFAVESVSNPAQRAHRWDEITKTFNGLSRTLSGKTMTKDQVRRRWNNMKKMTRKKWESFERDANSRDDPDSSEPPANSATFEITRKEMEINGKTSTTIVVLNVTDKEKIKQSQANYSQSNLLNDEDSEDGISKKDPSNTLIDIEDCDSNTQKHGQVETHKKRSQLKRLDEQQLVLEALEKLGSQDEQHAKKRLRTHKKVRTADLNFSQKKADAEMRIRNYQKEMNEFLRLNNELSQRIIEKQLLIEKVEEEVDKLEHSI